MMYLGDKAVGINKLSNITELTLNINDVRNAYVSTTINQSPSFTNSNYTYSYVDAISVKANILYIIIITNDAEPAATSIRNSVIVVDGKVREIVPVYTAPSTDNIIGFIPKNNGSLILCADKKNHNIQIYEIILS